jgi:hypothetical protein
MPRLLLVTEFQSDEQPVRHAAASRSRMPVRQAARAGDTLLPVIPECQSDKQPVQMIVTAVAQSQGNLNVCLLACDYYIV